MMSGKNRFVFIHVYVFLRKMPFAVYFFLLYLFFFFVCLPLADGYASKHNCAEESGKTVALIGKRRCRESPR